MKVILTDLMLNDPIIANYPPEDVYRSFVQLIQIAPNAASKAETLRILLRKILTAGTLEPKDVQDLIRMEYEILRVKKQD